MAAISSARLRPIVALVAACVALSTVFGKTSIAYVASGPAWAAAPVQYFVNTANLDLPASAVESAVRAGADAWYQQAGTGPRFTFAGQSSQATTTNDRINLVMFRNASSGSAIATTYWWSSGTRIIDADMVFWDGGFRFFAGSSGCSGGFYIEDIAAHEFGHALGLGHSDSTTATMYYAASSCNASPRTLDADDIAGVRALYPVQAPPSVSPPTGLRLLR